MTGITFTRSLTSHNIRQYNFSKSFKLLYKKIRVSKGGFKFLDWQIAQSRVYFVPLYENKKI